MVARALSLERSISRLRAAVSEFTLADHELIVGRIEGSRNALICFMCDEHSAVRTVPIDSSVTCQELERAVIQWSGSTELFDATERLGDECVFTAWPYRGDRGISVGASISVINSDRVLRLTAKDE
jgi:hypothetical protein